MDDCWTILEKIYTFELKFLNNLKAVYCIMEKTFAMKFLLLALVSFICTSYINANEKYIYTLLNSGNRYIPMANCIYKEKNLYVWIGTNKGAYTALSFKLR